MNCLRLQYISYTLHTAANGDQEYLRELGIHNGRAYARSSADPLIAPIVLVILNICTSFTLRRIVEGSKADHQKPEYYFIYDLGEQSRQ